MIYNGVAGEFLLSILPNDGKFQWQVSNLKSHFYGHGESDSFEEAKAAAEAAAGRRADWTPDAL